MAVCETDTTLFIHIPLSATQLELHHRRRNANQPTLSALIGLATTAGAAWACWAGRYRRDVLLATPPQFGWDWCDQWLERRSGLDALVAGLDGRTEYDVVTAISRHPAGARIAAAERHALYRRLRAANAPQQHETPLPADDAEALLLALVSLADPDRLPALTVNGCADVSLMHDLLTIAYRLLSRQPALPLALLLSESQYRTLQQSLPQTRATALLREGVIRLGEQPRQTTPTAPADTAPGFGSLQPGIAALNRLRPTPAMWQDFFQLAERAASRDSDSPTDARAPDRARSHAERLLFACLQRHPATAGRFQQNVRLPIDFGGRPLEVDLLAAAAGLAVEVDGYYHFRDAEAYRRDRRKDLLLQQHGYRVLRVLADDVAGRLDDVLGTLVSALDANPDGAAARPLPPL